jgi:hypothetical protein
MTLHNSNLGLGMSGSLCPWWVSWLGTCFADVEAAKNAETMAAALPAILPPPAPETKAELENPSVWSEEFWKRYYAEQQAARESFIAGQKPKCAWYQKASDKVAEGCETNITMLLMVGGVGVIGLIVALKR